MRRVMRLWRRSRYRELGSSPWWVMPLGLIIASGGIRLGSRLPGRRPASYTQAPEPSNPINSPGLRQHALRVENPGRASSARTRLMLRKCTASWQPAHRSAAHHLLTASAMACPGRSWIEKWSTTVAVAWLSPDPGPLSPSSPDRSRTDPVRSGRTSVGPMQLPPPRSNTSQPPRRDPCARLGPAQDYRDQQRPAEPD